MASTPFQTRARALVILLALGACQKPAPPTFMVELETDAAVTQQLGPAGGSLSAASASGVGYTLVVPPLALDEAIEITLTPARVSRSPFSGSTFYATAALGPSGLSFLRGARLEVAGIADADPAPNVSLSVDDSGALTDLGSVERTGDLYSQEVWHFSSLATGFMPTRDRDDGQRQLAATASAAVAGVQVQVDVIAAESIGQEGGAVSDADMARIEQLLIDFFEQTVRPKLETANTDDSTRKAVAVFAAWVGLIARIEFKYGSSRPLATEQVKTGNTLVASALLRGLKRLNDDMVAGGGGTYACTRALHWSAVAQSLGLDKPGSGLTLTEIAAAFKLQPVIDALTFPKKMLAADLVPLELTAGLQLNGGPSKYDEVLNVTLDLNHGLPSAEGLQTKENSGEAKSSPLRLDGNSMDINVEVTWPRCALPLRAERKVHADGDVRIRLTPPTGLMVNQTGTLSGSMEKGAEPLIGAYASLVNGGPGMLGTSLIRTDNAGRFSVPFTTSASPGSTTITLNWADSEDPAQPTYSPTAFISWNGSTQAAITDLNGTWTGTATPGGECKVVLTVTGTTAGSAINGTYFHGFSSSDGSYQYLVSITGSVNAPANFGGAVQSDPSQPPVFGLGSMTGAVTKAAGGTLTLVTTWRGWSANPADERVCTATR
jgi:hypothetical protein